MGECGATELGNGPPAVNVLREMKVATWTESAYQ